MMASVYKQAEPRFAPVRGVIQRKCACAGRASGGTACAQCGGAKDEVQKKLAIGASNDPLEQEADRVADQVLADRPRADFSSVPLGVRRDTVAAAGRTGQAPQSVRAALAEPGRPLDLALRRDMEARFDRDFSQVRVHRGAGAELSSREIGARAYTVGNDIVFGSGQFAPETPGGRRLVAHELTHVVQQSGTGAGIVRRDTFVGALGTTALDKDRPLAAGEGPMKETLSPSGTIVPKTESLMQNCAGDSTGIAKWINWPGLGLEAPNVVIPAAVRGDWITANQFVPSGCTRVNCTGVDTHHSRCSGSELDSIVFLYRWPVDIPVQGGLKIPGTRSDFHMIGRDSGSLPAGWHSKMDRREKVVDIRDPLQSLHDAYPDTKKKDRTINKLCFCCDATKIQAK